MQQTAKKAVSTAELRMMLFANLNKLKQAAENRF